MADRTVAVSFVGHDKGLKDTGDKIAAHFDSVASRAKSTFLGVSAAIGGAFALGGVMDFFKGGIEQSQLFAKNAAQTSAVIKSTGGAAGITATQVRSLASAIEDQTTVAQENVEAGENMLLTFTNVRNAAGKGNDVFNQATRTLTDMSVAMGSDMSQQAIQLGKALNDPIMGISALSKVGVTFDEQQKKQIKTLVQHGDTIKAQKIILGELNREFGGSAEALGKTPASAVARLKDMLGDTAQAMVEKVAPAFLAVVPTVQKVATLFLDYLGKAIDFLVPLFGQVSTALTGVQGTVQSVVPTVGGLFQTLREEGMKLIAPFRDFFQTMVSGVTTFWSSVSAKLIPFVKQVMPAMQEIFRTVLSTVRDVMPTITALVKTAFTFLTGATTTAIDLMSFAWDHFGKNIVKGIQRTFDLIAGVIKGVAKAFDGVLKILDGIIHGDWQKVWDGFKNVVSGVFGTIDAILKGVVGTVQTLIGLIGDAVQAVGDIGKSDADKKIKEQMTQQAQAQLDKMRREAWLTSDIQGYIDAWKKRGIKLHAAGGVITQPIMGFDRSGGGHMFGEAGPEAVIPLRDLGKGGGGTVNVTINVSGNDPDGVVRALKQYMRRAGAVPIKVTG